MSIKDIQRQVAAAETRAGHVAGTVKLIAVSKRQPDARVSTVLEHGHRIFGENTVQEAARKWPGFRQHYSEIELHMLGPLQTNKVRQAMELFDYIHSVDRLKLARTLARLAAELGHCPRLFIQVNTGCEPQKAGVEPEALPEFIAECRQLELPVIGLMCLPPIQDKPTRHFELLKKLAENHAVDELSMGMSRDFPYAIAQGASYVRIGSAIFGERKKCLQNTT